jgi:hypothetical protein
MAPVYPNICSKLIANPNEGMILVFMAKQVNSPSRRERFYNDVEKQKLSQFKKIN